MEEAAPDASAPPEASAANPPDAAALIAAFDAPAPGTVGIEDEIMLLDPDTLELSPVAPAVLARARPEDPLKLELPSSQLEVLTPVRRYVSALAAPLLAGRRRASELCADLALPAVAAVHPFSPGVGELNRLPRYRHTLEEYGPVAVRQLVCATQVHVAVGSAAAALAVYNAARAYLPLVAALAANGPIYEGQDSGLSSVRPKLSALLPRQGVPPAFESWEALASAYRFGARFGTFPEPRTWWWELRPHPLYGTLEFRVPDGQTTAADALAIAAVIQALVAWLADRHAAGNPLPVPQSWRIDENRWSACRHGVDGHMADLDTGRPRRTRDVLLELLEVLAPVAARLHSTDELTHARAMVARGGAVRQREVFAADGARGVAAWLAGRFVEPPGWLAEATSTAVAPASSADGPGMTAS